MIYPVIFPAIVDSLSMHSEASLFILVVLYFYIALEARLNPCARNLVNAL